MIITMWLAQARAGVSVEQDSGDAVRAVSVEMVCGSLSISGGSRSNVRVTGSVDDSKGLEISSSGGSVHIVLRSVIARRENCGQLQIELPAVVEVQMSSVSAPITARGLLGEVDIESVSGSVTLEGAPASIEIETVSGSVRVDAPARDTEIESVSGELVLSGVGGDIELASVSGDIELRAGSDLKRVEASSVSGDIEIAGALASGAKLEAGSHSGDITLLLPETTKATVETSSFSGQITNSLAPAAGDSHVELSTFSGSVRIARLSP